MPDNGCIVKHACTENGFSNMPGFQNGRRYLRRSRQFPLPPAPLGRYQ
jgi:hypothetical protein